jgi:hypothetical protein
MAKAKRVQWWRGVRIVSMFLFLALTALIDVVALREPAGTNPKDALISLSAVPPVVLWVTCWPLAFARRRAGPPGRLCWAIACVLLWVHIAVAFHLGHGWSHRAAWEHTRAVGGYGDGIFVNYAFAVVWLIDAVWALFAFDSYRTRPGWLHWSIHGFLAFVVFNAAVVFATTPMLPWIFGALVLLEVVGHLVRRYRRARKTRTRPEPDRTTDLD